MKRAFIYSDDEFLLARMCTDMQLHTVCGFDKVHRHPFRGDKYLVTFNYLEPEFAFNTDEYIQNRELLILTKSNYLDVLTKILKKV